MGGTCRTKPESDIWHKTEATAAIETYMGLTPRQKTGVWCSRTFRKPPRVPAISEGTSWKLQTYPLDRKVEPPGPIRKQIS